MQLKRCWSPQELTDGAHTCTPAAELPSGAPREVRSLLQGSVSPTLTSVGSCEGTPGHAVLSRLSQTPPAPAPRAHASLPFPGAIATRTTRLPDSSLPRDSVPTWFLSTDSPAGSGHGLPLGSVAAGQPLPAFDLSVWFKPAFHAIKVLKVKTVPE